ncbi:MAG: hypothetical protein ACTS4W_00850 [Candidatus Hodgkinia cicadicola]
MNISAAQPQWINLRKITSVSTSVPFYKSFTSVTFPSRRKSIRR